MIHIYFRPPFNPLSKDLGNSETQHVKEIWVSVVFLCLSDCIVFLENVLSAHFNRMRDECECETMETNQTKTVAESLRHNYSAASTFSVLLFAFIATQKWNNIGPASLHHIWPVGKNHSFYRCFWDQIICCGLEIVYSSQMKGGSFDLICWITPISQIFAPIIFYLLESWAVKYIFLSFRFTHFLNVLLVVH